MAKIWTQKEIEDKSKELKKALSDFDKEKMDRLKEVEAHEKRKKTLTDEIEALETKIPDRYRSIESELKAKLEEADKRSRLLSAREQKINEREALVCEAQKALDNKEKSIEAEFSSKSADLEKKSQKIAESKQNAEFLTEGASKKLAELNEKEAIVAKEIKAMDEKSVRLSSELADVISAQKHLDSKIAENKKLIEVNVVTLSEITAKKQEIDSLMARLRDKEADIENKMDVLAKKEAELNDKQIAIELGSKQNEEAQEEVKVEWGRIKMKERILEKESKEVSAQKRAIDEYQRKIGGE